MISALTGSLHHVELWVPNIDRAVQHWGWRTRPGVNHLAFHAGNHYQVDRLTAAAAAHGWTLLFADKHPYAGGSDHYAAYLADTDGSEVELIANGS